MVCRLLVADSDDGVVILLRRLGGRELLGVISPSVANGDHISVSSNNPHSEGSHCNNGIVGETLSLLSFDCSLIGVWATIN